MDPTRADQVFQAALDLPAAEREAFCRSACGDDRDLLDEVLGLLALDPGTHGNPFGEAPLRLGPADRQIGDPARIGPFRILQRLGSGGFGVVYEAEQLEPVRRRIALKVLKAGMDTEEVLARFDAERQALAMMDHPNIARVLDIGATGQGRPWFAMELVRGEPITRYCDQERLALDERIELFLQVCRAVQHAHQKGVIHRDLKPSNLLVTRVDGQATPKVIDFGIAKAVTTPLVDRTLRTVAGSMMGTPTYMSPEQAGPTRLDVDTATDVYSLGVVLYELLCGELPVAPDLFDAATPVDYAQLIRETKRRAPSERLREVTEAVRAHAAARHSDPWTLRERLRNDLDWITMRAIATDRERRYQTVQQLEQELRRYQADEPVEAGPPGVRYRMGKFARRHRAELTVVAAILAVLLGSGAALTWALVDANRQRAEAVAARAEAEVVVNFLSEMLAAPRPVAEGRDVTVAEVLDQAAAAGALHLPDQPAVEARLRSVIGATYRELGRRDEARQQLETALALQERELGPQDPVTLETVRNLGLVYRESGDYETARAHFSRAVEGLRAAGPADSVALARALECHGSAWLLDEHPAEALPFLEEAYAIARRSIPRDHDVHVAIISDLGVTWSDLGDYDRAEPFLVEGYENDVARWGPRDPRTMASAQNLGSFLRETGRPEESIPLYRQAYAAALEHYGEGHPYTMRCRSNLALALSDAARYEEALEHSEGVVATRERELGLEASPTLASRINLGLLYHRLGEEARAEAHLRETAARCRHALGIDHLYTLLSEGLIAETQIAQGRAAEALPGLRDTLGRLEATRGADHWRTAHVRVSLGMCLLELGQREEARRELVAARAALLESFPADHARVQRADEQLARLD